jgi:propanediol utilization protein
MGSACSGVMAAPIALPAVTVNAYELERQDIALQTTIVQVDRANNTITVKGPEGQEETLEVSGRVRDLTELKVGDKVTAHYMRAVALQLLPADDGKPGVEYSGSAGATDDAEGAIFQSRHTETVTATLSAINVARNTITLTGADGHKRIIDVHQLKQRNQLGDLKAGDLVRVTYVDAAAISLDPAGEGQYAR